jgi:hypothetical protein
MAKRFLKLIRSDKDKEGFMVSPDVVKVQPQEDYTLIIWFENGEKKLFDMKPYIEKGPIFRELKEKNLFWTARPVWGTVQWANEADLCPDTFYLDSVSC